MTLAEKLENFKTMPVGFHVKTEEIACLLGEAMDSVGIRGGFATDARFTMGVVWGNRNERDLCVTMNHPLMPERTFGHGDVNCMGELLDEIYEVTIEELKEYLDTIGYLKKLQKPTCFTCKFYDNFTGACGNGLSEHRGGFTDATDSCDRHKRK